VATHVENCTGCQHALEQLTAQPKTVEQPLSDPQENDRVARLLERLQTKGPRAPELEEEDDARDRTRQVTRSKDPARGESSGTTPPSRSTPLYPAIDGFRIIREVGRGGMGIVYEAIEEDLNRRVALKILPSSALPEAKQVERFRREARAAARLHHTNIVP